MNDLYDEKPRTHDVNFIVNFAVVWFCSDHLFP